MNKRHLKTFDCFGMPHNSSLKNRNMKILWPHLKPKYRKRKSSTNIKYVLGIFTRYSRIPQCHGFGIAQKSGKAGLLLPLATVPEALHLRRYSPSHHVPFPTTTSYTALLRQNPRDHLASRSSLDGLKTDGSHPLSDSSTGQNSERVGSELSLRRHIWGLGNCRARWGEGRGGGEGDEVGGRSGGGGRDWGTEGVMERATGDDYGIKRRSNCEWLMIMSAYARRQGRIQDFSQGWAPSDGLVLDGGCCIKWSKSIHPAVQNKQQKQEGNVACIIFRQRIELYIGVWATALPTIRTEKMTSEWKVIQRTPLSPWYLSISKF